MTDIVTCREVTKTYQQGKVEVKAVEKITLDVQTGSFMALAGPSGSGKTTLLNLIGGLDLPDSGDIRVNGQSYADLSSARMADLRLHKIGFVFQAYNLIPVLSAVENVEYVMLLQGAAASERRNKAIQILDEVGLEGKYNRRPAELSGGQQQRVAVARAIVANPAIVLADEPTANLDSKTGESLLQLMLRMNRERQVTFIFSTHDNMVMAYARRLVMLKDGRIADEQTRIA
jgi:putative ABC transport system ATP-binding protein